jgi:hypothetical protein
VLASHFAARPPTVIVTFLNGRKGDSLNGGHIAPMSAHHPLWTLDGPQLPVTVEQPSSGIPPVCQT